MIGPLELYEQALLSSDCGGDVLRVRYADGSLRTLPIDRYAGSADCLDRALLEEVEGPVLDVGCGPGRHLGWLAQLGIEGLGVDLSEVAVAAARRRGVRAVVGDIFGEVPLAGSWATALLLDGNIGIGGRPDRLLARLGDLLVANGRVLVELEPPGADTRSVQARVESTRSSSHWFDWGRASVSEIVEVAALGGMTVERSWECGERWFACLRSPSPA